MRTTRFVGTCVVVIGILMLAGGVSFAQLMSAPPNPEYIEWLSNLGRVPDMTADGHAFGYIPPPFQTVDSGRAPFGYIPPDWQPTTYDLRNTTNKVPAVRDQSTCGSCWTFATFGSLETCQRPTDTTDFSENNLRAHHGWDYGPCAGGHPWMSMAYMARWSGPVWESDDGYTATDPVSPASPSMSPRRHMQEALFLPAMTGPTDLSTIQNAIMNYGAAYINYYHDNTYYEASTGAFYHPSATTTNHAVCAVGWNNNYASTNFKTGSQPAGNGAWLVRNSWGTGWGNSGYFWVSYYDARFGKSVVSQFRTTEATSNYQHNYDYDPLGNVSALNTPYMANVFTASGNQTVKAVSFYTEAAGANYTVRIYRNPSPVPTGGTPVTTQTGSFTYAGYHTVVLSSPVTVASGNTFSVSVHITSGGTHPAAFEYAVASVTSSATASAGQSYYSFDGSNWVDLTTYNSTANFCVKAFTDNATAPTVNSITPNTGPNYGTTSVTNLAGTNFQTGATVTLKKTGESDIAATSVVVVSATQITCSLPLTGAAAGAWDVVVTNLNTLFGTLSGGFTVTTHTVTASITSITPNPEFRGQSVTFTGSGTCTHHSIAAHDWQSNLDGQIGTTASFSTTTLSRGNHVIQYRVQCSAGAWSTPVSYTGNPLVIKNNPPTVASVAITPDPAYTTDNLTATPSGWNDADGDSEGYDWAWEKDSGGGFAVISGATTDTLGNANFVKGDTLRVTCTPNDGTDTGTSVTDDITISNAAPTVTSVAITPDPAYTTDDLLATPSGWNDADGDSEGYDWAWEKDSGSGFAAITGANTNTLGNANFVPGDTLRVTATPNDGTDTGTPVTDDITIGNNQPTAPTVAITPTDPTTNDSFRATASGSTDADGDPIIYSYQWYKNGALQVGVTWRTIGASRTRSGQVWRCVVTPNDGTENGPTGEDTVTVNDAPSAPTVTITPGDPISRSTLEANATGSVDPEGDPVTYIYRWFKNGALQPDLTGLRFIRPWRTRAGQVWRCVVTPTDGLNAGPTGEDTVIINTRPTAPTVVIAPAVPATNESFRATASGSTDADGDPITYAYRWYKNGVEQPGVTWQRIGAWRTRVGETWKVVVTPSDLHGPGKPGEATVTIAAKGGPLMVSGLAALPTARGAEIAFTLSAEANVTCEVLNIAGRAVKTVVVDRPMDEGINSLAWDGRNAAGLRAPAGMYLVRMTATAASGARWTAMGTLNLTR